MEVIISKFKKVLKIRTKYGQNFLKIQLKAT